MKNTSTQRPAREDVHRPSRGLDVRFAITGRALDPGDLAKIIGAIAAAIAAILSQL